MSSDYTPRKDGAFALPPVPYTLLAIGRKDLALNYGHACAEAGRAPLLEELNLVKANFNRVSKSFAEACSARDEARARIVSLETRVAELEALSVTNILLEVVPGEHGDGVEIYARSVEAVYEELQKGFEETDRLRAEVEAKAVEISSLRGFVAEYRRAAVACMNSVIETRGCDGMDGLSNANEKARVLLAQPAGEWINPLAAEVEALRADAVIEFEPGRTIALSDLVRRVVGNLTIKPKHSKMLWPAAMETFGVGSTVACYLCRWAGRDPDTGKDIDDARAAKGEGIGP